MDKTDTILCVPVSSTSESTLRPRNLGNWVVSCQVPPVVPYPAADKSLSVFRAFLKFRCAFGYAGKGAETPFPHQLRGLVSGNFGNLPMLNEICFCLERYDLPYFLLVICSAFIYT